MTLQAADLDTLWQTPDDADRTQTRLVAALHDLNQSLAIGWAGLDVIEHSLSAATPGTQLLRQSLERMGRLVRDMRLAMSDDVLIGAYDWIAPAALLEQVLGPYRLLAPQLGCQLTLYTPSAPLPRIWGDAGQLVGAITRLLDNAVLHTAAAHSERGAGVITVTAVPHAAGVQLSIRDTGPGVANALLAQLGEQPISQSRYGLGIGVFLSRRALIAHGGWLTYASN